MTDPHSPPRRKPKPSVEKLAGRKLKPATLISEKTIRRGSFHSVRDLVAKIDHFVTHYNQTCQPFVWTATADSILAKLERLCSRINGTEH